jgi:hypothetical protein
MWWCFSLHFCAPEETRINELHVPSLGQCLHACIPGHSATLIMNSNNFFDNLNFFHELLMKKMVGQGTYTYKENWLKPKYSNNLVDRIIQMINLALLSLLLVCNATQPNSPNLRNSKFLNTTKKDKTKQNRKKKQQQIWRKYWQFVWYLTKVDWQTSPKRRIPVGSSSPFEGAVYKA